MLRRLVAAHSAWAWVGPKSPDTQVPLSAASCAGVGVLARAITSHGPQRLTRGSNHDHRPARSRLMLRKSLAPKSNPRSPSPTPAPAARGAGSDPGPGLRTGGGAARAPAGR